jgi:hypothetical protein
LDDETLDCPVLLESVVFESVLPEPVLFELVLLLSALLESSDVPVVDDVSDVLAVDVEFVECVAARAASPKPALAATAVTARPAVIAAARRLPCSRAVMAPPSKGSTSNIAVDPGRWL